MSSGDRGAGFKLIETGTLVEFRDVEVQVEQGVDEAEFAVRIELRLGLEGDDPADVVEWGAFGFLFVLGVLSFADARPRGLSEMEYQDKDEFLVSDFFECLRFERGQLHFHADYIRGRRIKTDIVVRQDGTVSLATVGRGKTALRWLDRLKGKKFMELVDADSGPGSRG